jgi:hypothetical protein
MRNSVLIVLLLVVRVAFAQDAPDLANFYNTTAGSYQVLTQGGRQIGADVNWFMNEMLKQYSSFFSNWSPKNAARVVVLSDLVSFQTYARDSARLIHPGLVGYCRPTTDGEGNSFVELVTYQHDNLYRTLAHEGFHQFLLYELGDRAPIWLNEGMAQYFETSTVVHNKLQVGQISRSTLLTVRYLVEQKKAPAIADLIQMDRATFYRLSPVTYPTSWALVYFLLHREGDKYNASNVRHYFTDLKLGKNPASSFTTRFGRNPKELRAEFERYVFKLKARFE